MKWIYYVGLVVLTISACKKKEDKGASKVQITYTLPVLGDTVQSYNQVHAEGTISGDGTMKGYNVFILNTATGVELFSNKYDIEASAYNFHEHWVNNLSDTTQVTVRVEAIKDVDGNKFTKEMKVICLP
ncbi:MAG: hypothetical protein WC044_12030 [Crocinitomicaceae bacterium]